MTTAYLAGPMSGYVDFNFPAFHAAAKHLRDIGFEEVLNPAENHDGRQDLSWQEYLDTSLEQVARADVVYLLPGWADSKGAQLEVEKARELGKAVAGPYAWMKQGEKDPDAVVKGHPDFKDYFEQVDKDIAAAKPAQIFGQPGLLEDDETGQNLLSATEGWTKVDDTILDEAKRLVRGPRQATYDHPLDNHERIAKIWSGILGVDVTAEQAAMCMVGVKLSREAFRPKRDNRVDLAGYALVLDEIVTERERRA